MIGTPGPLRAAPFRRTPESPPVTSYTATATDRKVSVIFWVLLAVMAASGWGLWTGTGNAKVGILLFVIAGWLVSLSLHEFAHARAALFGGDLTVGAKGYLTLNLLKYVNPLYSIVLPVVFILLGGIALPGGAVMIERGRIDRRWKHSLISAVGPLTNLVLAVVLLLVLTIPQGAVIYGNTIYANSHLPFWSALGYLAELQVIAGLLNLIPMPGLDGYGIIEPWLSPATRRSLANLAPFGMMIVFLLLWNTSINGWFFHLVDDVTGWFGTGPQNFAVYGQYLFHDAFHFHLAGFGN